MEVNNNNCPKRPRKDESNQTIRHRTIMNASSPTTEDLQEKSRSVYERKMGKTIAICSKCQGEGKLRARLSKKARALRKRMEQQISNNSSANSGGEGDDTPKDNVAPPQMKACRVCEGSGLIAIPPPSESNNESSERTTTNSSEATGRPQPSSQAMIQPDVSVAIIGGGIGGIALAAALQHRNIPAVVYERDTSFEERKQGYGLTMQQGARALRSLGFFSFSDNDENDNESRTNNNNGEGLDDSTNKCDPTTNSKTKFGIHSTRHVVHKPDGTVVGEWGMKVWGGRFEKNGRKHAKRQNAHISRQNLRKLLLEMLVPGTIRWGCKFTGYSDASGSSTESDDDGSANSRLKLTFRRRRSECRGITEEECEEEMTANATIVVGCDGIRSVVREKKLGDDVAPLRYLGCIVVLGITASPDSALTDGETVFQTADGVTRLYAMPFARPEEKPSVIAETDSHGDCNDGGLSMWQLSFPMEEADARKLSQLGPSALKAEALKRCSRWHDPIPRLLSQTSADLITGYPCYDRALVDKAIFREGCSGAPNDVTGNPFVTMLGDAAHPMSPFKGQGANQALLDAVLLARKLHSVFRVSKKKHDGETKNHVGDRIPIALAEFEDEMLRRSAVKVKKSADAAKFLHSPVAISEGNVTRGAAALEDAANGEEGKNGLD